MLKVYGMPLSNYFSMLKNVLIERGIEFEEVMASPNQKPEMLANSPLGKVPYIETEDGFLSETAVIIDFLEEKYEGASLYPADEFQRAKVRELMRMVEHYIETPAHSMLGLFFGRDVPQEVKDHFEPLINRGLAALDKLSNPSPYLLGEELTHADIFAYWSLSLAQSIMKMAYDRDLTKELPWLADWQKTMLSRESTSTLAAATKAAQQAMAAAAKK
ncbi:MAG: glutathione S-transferase family protein [Cellvibrionaceae bacterium]